MVMRYWGDADAYPDAFSPLVDHSAGGILTTALAADLERRGWTAVAGPGDTTELARELGRGRPIVALIEDRPGRYHYVVVVDRSNGHVVVHDPARGPSRTLDGAHFDTAWARSGRWMMILLPPPAPATARRVEIAERANRASAGGTACAALVDDGVARAGDDRPGARVALTRATSLCPGDGAAWRELAGLDALDADWSAAAAHAERAVSIDRGDTLAWRILATAHYLRDDDIAALAAWNHLGEPKIDLVDIKGLAHTRYDVVADAIGVPLRSVLTPDAMKRAERRVRDVPAIAAARVTFRPGENGDAQIDAAVVERDRAPVGYASWLRAGFDAATGREVTATFTNLSGGGEAAGVTWRWWEHRPMIAGFYAAPAPRAIGGGVWRLEASRETQTFASAAFGETRTRAGMSLARWMTDRTRVTAGAFFERWTTRASDVAVSGAVERWMAANRVKLRADVSQAIGGDPFTTAGVTAAIRSSSANDGFTAFALAGYRAATQSSPASVWPGADTGHASDVLLRAHPLLDDGIVTGAAFGRQLAFGTVEAQRWTRLHRMPLRIAPAAFIDVARATRGLAAGQLEADAGAGVRLALPAAGVIRLDVARGIRDGGTVFSAGWDLRWR